MFESCWLAIERMWAAHGCTTCILFEFSMDWFEGKSTGKPHDLNGKIDGFRLRFSRENQSCLKFRRLLPAHPLRWPCRTRLRAMPGSRGPPVVTMGFNTQLAWLGWPVLPRKPPLWNLWGTLQKQTNIRKYTVSNSSLGVEHGQICVVMFQVLEIRTTAWNQNHSVGIDNDCPHGCNTASDHSATGLEPSIRCQTTKTIDYTFSIHLPYISIRFCSWLEIFHTSKRFRLTPRLRYQPQLRSCHRCMASFTVEDAGASKPEIRSFPFVMIVGVTLWWTNIAMENGHRNSGFSHEKLWFSIAMLVHQRVPPVFAIHIFG